MKTIVFPGLDGSAQLLQRFAQVSPSRYQVETVSYPRHLVALEDYVRYAVDIVQSANADVIIAESFSGAVWLHALGRLERQLSAMIFVATFTAPPHALYLRAVSLLPRALVAPFMHPAMKAACLNGGIDAKVIKQTVEVIQRLDYGKIRQRLALLSRLPQHLDTSSQSTPAQKIIYLQANQDRLVPRSAAEDFLRLFPGLSLQCVEGPHFLLQGRPLEVWRVIDAVLDGL